jgi:hypothetical protein
VSKLKAIIDSGIRSGVDKSQPPRQMPQAGLDPRIIEISKKYGVSIPVAYAMIQSEDAEAGMLDLGLRVLRGDSFDQIPEADPVESLVLGLSRQQSMENQGRDFVPTPDEMLESMSTIS